MQQIELSVVKRDVFGKKAKTLVDDGKILGNIFGKDIDSVAVAGDELTMNRVIRQAGKNHPIELKVEGGDDHLVLLTDVDRDVVTDKIRHVSFHVIKRGEKVNTEVPIKFVGDAPAAMTGKIVVTLMDEVEIAATPTNIPEYLEVSLESLEEVGDQIIAAELAVPEDVDLMVEPDSLIAKVDIPRAEIEEEEDEEGEDEELDAADVPSDHGGESEEDGDGNEAKEEEKKE